MRDRCSGDGTGVRHVEVVRHRFYLSDVPGMGSVFGCLSGRETAGIRVERLKAAGTEVPCG